MRLNPDCIRDLLMTIEETTTYYNLFSYDPENNCHERLKEYSEDEILYHLRQCNETGFLLKCSFTLSGSCHVIDLTPMVHQFLADIRSDNVWNKTKDTAKKVGSSSLDTLMKIASGIITTLISSTLQGNVP